MRMLFAAGGGLLFIASLAYGAFAYLVTFGIPAGSWSWRLARGPLLVDIALFTVFALHHSAFARSGLKQWVSARVSRPLERSVYVWIASGLFIAVCAWWRPVPGTAWAVSGAAAWLLIGLQLAGVLLTAHASKQLGVLELAGLAQAADAPPRPTTLLRTGGYRLVRHPIYLGWVLMVWATPEMTGTRLAFAAISTLYLVLAVPFEERSLRASMPGYGDYATRVRWRMLPFLY